MKHPKRWLSLYLILFLFAVITLWPRQANILSNPLRNPEQTKPLLIAHGGGNLEFPDNTLEAFYHAYSVDSSVMMETDISITKDGVLILSHDTTLDRKTSLVNASIHEVNYIDLVTQEMDFAYENPVSPKSNGFNVSQEFRRYKDFEGQTKTPVDVQYPNGISARHTQTFLVTTLEELIRAFPNSPINVEIKQSGDLGKTALNALIHLLDELDAEYNTYERIVLASFHQEIFQEFQKLKKSTHPELLFSPATQSVTKAFLLYLFKLDLFYRDEVAVFQLPMSQMGLNLATKRLVTTYQAKNIAIHYWTIDDPDDMRYLISIGVDGIMTNRPTLLKQILDES